MENNRKEISISEIIKNKNLDLSERINLYSTKGDFSSEDLKELAIASIKQEYEYWANNRTNISLNTNRMLEQIKDGHILNNIEAFEMMCDNPKQVEEYRKYEILRKRIFDNNGITKDDFEEFCQIVGFDSQTKDKIENEFNMRGLILDSYQIDEEHYHR